MVIALIGYGKMGHEIEAIAKEKGHVTGLIIDQDNIPELNRDNLEKIDIAFEFTSPASAFGNIMTCLNNGVPVVTGSTGWLDRYDEAVAACRKNDTAFIYASNYSIGVNLFFMLNEQLARQMERYSSYNVSLEEIHHIKKLDAPSGTAISLSEGITENHSRYNGWSPADKSFDDRIPVKSIREGSVPGTHIVKWDSEIDSITLKHEAKNRKGFALGAVLAAEYIHNRKGVFTMKEVMGF
ncbi:MAG TPA: 4-hydroxy-tetrahydrodipicolinate reductase [Bacteroidales bacterium]|nr:4-hydroxy-tetrahydrodipicolinate reductase [Bacteroidales bacterium]